MTKLFYKTIHYCLKKKGLPTCIIDYICKNFIVGFPLKDIKYILTICISKYSLYWFKYNKHDKSDYYVAMEENFMRNYNNYNNCKCFNKHDINQFTAFELDKNSNRIFYIRKNKIITIIDIFS